LPVPNPASLPEVLLGNFRARGFAANLPRCLQHRPKSDASDAPGSTSNRTLFPTKTARGVCRCKGGRLQPDDVRAEHATPCVPVRPQGAFKVVCFEGADDFVVLRLKQGGGRCTPFCGIAPQKLTASMTNFGVI